MYTDTQLQAIKLFGRKDLTEGCIIHGYECTNYNDISEDFTCVKFQKESDPGFSYQTYIISTEGKEYYLYSILGHEPHLEDLFRVANENKKNLFVVQKYGTLTVLDAVEDEENQNSIVIPYNPVLQLLDQPSLPDIISLFK